MSVISPPVMAPPEELTLVVRPPFPAVNGAFGFMRERWVAMLGASAVVLIPCFWQRHINATDLGSHLYNAWLANLIQHGQAPGLSIVPQSSNVLFDLILSSLFNLFGPTAAERIAVSLAVLILFWGGFALCSAAAGHAAWSVTPLLAMTCYGWVFNMGFFNLYLSVGFSLFALAILWKGERWDYSLLAPLMVLIWMSHLLGTAGLLGIGCMVLVVRFSPLRWQMVVSAGAIGMYFVARWYVLNHFVIIKQAAKIFWMMGVDHFVVYRNSFEWVALAILTLAAVSIALGLRRDGREGLKGSSGWLLVYAVVAVAVACAPGGIVHPKLQYMGYVPDRASLYSALLLCCVLAVVRLQKWQVALFSAFALVFFSFLYFDTVRLDQSTSKQEQAFSSLPPGTRVASTFFLNANWRIYEQHTTDTACVGRCFYVANYEPSSGQFRIKATASNHIVEADARAATQMSRGVHLVTEDDLPLVEAYGCGPTLEDVCLRQLSAGEYNGKVAYEELEAYLKRNNRRGHE